MANKINGEERRFATLDFNPINVASKIRKGKKVEVITQSTRKDEQLSRLTAKQYLVLNFLCCNSKWDTNCNGHPEKHYFLYKKEFNQTDAAKKLGITRKTFYNAIKKLEELHCISEEGNDNPYYVIYLPKLYVPLDTRIARTLLAFAAQMTNGGYLIPILGVIDKYFSYCKKNDKVCQMSASQLCKIFKLDGTHKKDFIPMQVCIGVLMVLGFIDTEKAKKTSRFGNSYITNTIRNVNLKPDIEDYTDEDIAEIVGAVENG